MANGLNKVMIIGRLGADPEMRFTGQGTAVTRMSVAVSRRWRDTATGENQEHTEWFRVVAWDKLAELCNEYLSKGRLIYVEGRLQTRSWEDAATGERRYATEVVAEEVVFLDSAAPRAARAEPPVAVEIAHAAPPAAQGAGAAPARSSAANAPSAAGRNVPPSIDEDDLPF